MQLKHRGCERMLRRCQEEDREGVRGEDREEGREAVLDRMDRIWVGIFGCRCHGVGLKFPSKDTASNFLLCHYSDQGVILFEHGTCLWAPIILPTLVAGTDESRPSDKYSTPWSRRQIRHLGFLLCICMHISAYTHPGASQQQARLQIVYFTSSNSTHIAR
jgi:hypothetical protein